MKQQQVTCLRGIGEITEEPNCVLCTKLVSLREGLYIDATKVTRVWVHYDGNGARRLCGTFRVAVLMDLSDGKQTAFNSSPFRFEAQANEAAASVLREVNKIRSFNGLNNADATQEIHDLEGLFMSDREPEISMLFVWAYSFARSPMRKFIVWALRHGMRFLAHRTPWRDGYSTQTEQAILDEIVKMCGLK